MSQIPEVELRSSPEEPYNEAIATARQCYSSKKVSKEDVKKNKEQKSIRDNIAESVYDARHHTIFQHAHYTFHFSNISRQFVWSFLHSHPFYNTEQQSQRYVRMGEEKNLEEMFRIPEFKKESSDRIYRETIEHQLESYNELIEELEPIAEEKIKERFPSKSEKETDKMKEKKAQEIARYVLPVSTFTKMYHTVSALTLFRYNRLSEQLDVPEEQREVIDQMVDHVKKGDPNWKKIMEDPIPLEETLEHKVLNRISKDGKKRVGEKEAMKFKEEFDKEMKSENGNILYTKLINYARNGPENIADAVRTVLGVTENKISDEEVISAVLNPADNDYLSEKLTLAHTSKLSRAKFLSDYSFKHRISHTADSQAQRQRMSFGARPILTQHITSEPDYITPKLIRTNNSLKEKYEEIHEEIYEKIGALIKNGESKEKIQYLLPNSQTIRYLDRTDFLNLAQKFEKRLCLNAQEEIWNSSLQQKDQIAEVHPELTKHIGAPCQLRKKAEETPVCPEGDKYCGVQVWKRGNLDSEERYI